MSKRRADHKRAVVDRYKRSKGCSVCGYKAHPFALEFDHIDPASKRRTVASMMYSAWPVIKCEIAKCRILCANCHQIHSVEQRRFGGIADTLRLERSA